MGSLITKEDLVALKNLANSEGLIKIDLIPVSFKEDFDQFFYGKTLVQRGNDLYAYPTDISKWVAYVFHTYQK